MTLRKTKVLVVAAFGFLSASALRAEVPIQINHQGVVSVNNVIPAGTLLSATGESSLRYIDGIELGGVPLDIDPTGDGAWNLLNAPTGIAMDRSGNVYLPGRSSDDAFKITPGGVITELIDPTGAGACCSSDGMGGKMCTESTEGACLALGPEAQFHPNTSCGAPGFVCNQGCVWDNGAPEDGGFRNSQFDPNFPFIAATVDDFILNDQGPNPCRIDSVTAFVVHHNNGAPGSTPNQYEGVWVTVYRDTGLPPGSGKGPLGSPFIGPVGLNHDGNVVYSQFVPVALFAWTSISLPFLNANTGPTFQLDIPVNMVLKKETKYWLEIVPQVDFSGNGGLQTALIASTVIYLHPMQRGFPLLGIEFWEQPAIQGIAFRLNGIKDLPPPPNDDCINKEEIGDGAVHFDTTGATLDGPVAPPPCGSLDSDIWFNYRASCTGTLTASLCGSDFDTVLAIYNGFGCPAVLGNLIDCNDNACGPQSELTILVTQDQELQIQVGEAGGAQGNGTLTLKCLPLGACCDHAQPDGVCVGPVSEDTCLTGLGFGQPEFFENDDCAAVEARGDCEEATGACCDNADGTCREDILESGCTGATETWFKGLACCLTDCDVDGVTFDASGVKLLSQVDLTSFSGPPGAANDVWGYVSPSGRKYAIIGLECAAAFVEVTNPAVPIIVGEIPGPCSIWRAMQTFDEYAYVVSDAVVMGLQVVDLTAIDSGTVSLVTATDLGIGFTDAHDLHINTASGFLYLTLPNTNSGHGLTVVDVGTDPANPSHVGDWTDTDDPSARCHDAQVVSYTTGPNAGKEIAFCFGEGFGFKIADVTDKGNMFTLSTLVYPNTTYTHQGWLSEDGQFVFIDDELDELDNPNVTETTTYVIDVSDLSNPQFVTTFTSGLCSIDHNLMVRGNFVFQANYTTGLRIFNVSDPTNAFEVGHYDTHPETNLAVFQGAWGVYSDLPGGIVLVSDIERGLFVLDVSQAVGGACCDGSTGDCLDDVVEEDCPVDPADPLNQFRWEKGTSCADLVPPCTEHTGACCDKSLPGGVCTSGIAESACPTGDPQVQWFKDENCVEDGGTVACPEHTGACCDNATPGLCLGIITESECLAQATVPKFFKDGTCDDCVPACQPPVVIGDMASRYIEIRPDASVTDPVAFHIECGIKQGETDPNEGWVQLILKDYAENPAGTVLVNIGKTTPDCADADFLTPDEWTSGGNNALYVTGLPVCPSRRATSPKGASDSRPTVTARCVDCTAPDADPVQAADPNWVYCDSSGDGQTTFFSDLFKQFSNTAAAGGPNFTGPDLGIEVDTQGNWKDVPDQQVTFFSDIFQCFGATAAGGGDTWTGPTCP
ncbi:MAG: choice-of-anchor B family protein [Phycisphaerae bacterium]